MHFITETIFVPLISFFSLLTGPALVTYEQSLTGTVDAIYEVASPSENIKVCTLLVSFRKSRYRYTSSDKTDPCNELKPGNKITLDATINRIKGRPVLMNVRHNGVRLIREK